MRTHGSASIWLIIWFMWSVCDCLRHIPVKSLLKTFCNKDDQPTFSCFRIFWMSFRQVCSLHSDCSKKKKPQALIDRMISTSSCVLLLCGMCLNHWSVLSPFLWTPSSLAELWCLAEAAGCQRGSPSTPWGFISQLQLYLFRQIPRRGVN